MKRARTVPHTALIYTDKRSRNESLKSVIGLDHADWGAITVLSSNPKADRRLFRKREWRPAGHRGQLPLSVIDMKKLLAEKQQPTKEITAIIRRVCKHAPSESQPLVIGDWLHQVYDRFELGLTVEEEEARRQTRNLICCYRGEGFWSLDVKQIARVFEFHHQVLFSQDLFNMTG